MPAYLELLIMRASSGAIAVIRPVGRSRWRRLRGLWARRSSAAAASTPPLRMAALLRGVCKATVLGAVPLPCPIAMHGL